MSGPEQQVPEGYKQTEVGVIPESWEVKNLDEAADFLDGQRRPIKSGDRQKMKGDFRYYGASGVVDYVNNYIFDGSYILLGEDGENILSRSSSLAFRVDGKFWVNNHAHVMRPKDEFDINYLTAFLESLDYSLLNSGTAQPKLNKKSCLTIKVAKPAKKEQTAIANALSDVDALITSLEKLIVKKRAIKTAAMQQLLSGKKRLPPFDQTNTGYKQTELGEVPEDWEVKALAEIVDVRDGTHDSPAYQENGVPLVTSKNIVGNRLDLESASFISVEDAIEVNKRSQVHAGDVLMSMIGTIGSAVLVTEEPDYCIKNIALFKPKRILGGFLIQLVISPIFQNLLSDSLDGGIQKFVSLGSLRSLKIFFPSKEEQRTIAAVLSDMDEELSALEHRFTKTQQLKQGMMQELLTGRARLV